MISQLVGARAVITGGASGIGLAVASALVRSGAVVLLVDLDQGQLDQAANDLAKFGVVHTAVADVSSFEDLVRVERIADRLFGGTDILMNNAGVLQGAKPLWETSDETVKWMFGVNTLGVINGIRAFVPGMISSGGGHIVNTASAAGFRVRGGSEWYQALYASTKYAVVGMSEALRQDLEPYGIGVSVLAPSAVATRLATAVLDQTTMALPEDAADGMPGTFARRLSEAGMSSEVVAQLVLSGILANRRYIFTHPHDRDAVEERHEFIRAGFDDAERALALIRAEEAL